MTLVLHPQHHPRFGHSWSIPTAITVSADDGDGHGTQVLLELESEMNEQIHGPGSPYTAREEGGRERERESLMVEGDTLRRYLDPDEARALAAALCHHADEAERNQR